MMKGTSVARKALTKSIVLGLTMGMFGGFTIVNAAVGDPITSGDDSGINSAAIGDTSVATGEDSLAIAGGAASGQEAVAIGSQAIASGRASIVLCNTTVDGAPSQGYGYNDIVIGNHSLTANEPGGTTGGSIIVGTNSKITAGSFALIAGNLATVNASRGVALGTGSIVNNQNAVALGNDSVTSDTNIGTTAKGSSITLAGTETTYTYAGEAKTVNGTVSVGKAGAERQIQNVAAGDVTTTSTDAINGSQLAATNQAVQDVADKIGNVTTNTNGVSNTNTVGENIDAINNAVGDTNNYSSTNNITQGDSTVTAIGKLDDAIGTTTDGEYVSGDNSVGENLNALDDQVKTNADNIANNATNITNIQNTLDTGYAFGGDNDSDSVALGKQVTVAGGKNISTTFSKDATTGNATIQVTMNSNPDFDSVTVGGDTGIKINANGDKKITGIEKGTLSENSKDAVNGSQLYQTNQNVSAIDTKVGDVNNYTSNNYITNGDSLVENVSNLDQQVGTNTDNISKIGNNISGLSNKLNNLDSRVNKVGASSAALAALHPLDFDPDDKWDFSAGYGNYQGSNAMALGIFYRPNEDTMFSVGTTFGNGENMINAGVSFKIGGGNHISTSRVAMAKEIDALRQQVNQLTGMISGGSKAVATNFDVNKSAAFPDVPENHWAYEYVAKLAGNGIVDGYSDGEYRGDRTMTRYEMAAMLYRALIKGVQVDENMLKEFNPELERLIQVDGSRVHVVKR